VQALGSEGPADNARAFVEAILPPAS
jgi:hypothetical protein